MPNNTFTRITLMNRNIRNKRKGRGFPDRKGTFKSKKSTLTSRFSRTTNGRENTLPLSYRQCSFDTTFDITRLYSIDLLFIKLNSSSNFMILYMIL